MNSHNKRKVYYPFIFLPGAIVLVLMLLYYNYDNVPTGQSGFDWSGIRPELRDTIMELDKFGKLIRAADDNDPKVSQQWQRQYWLFEKASNEELLRLTDFPSGTIKGLAYEGLLRNKNNAQYELFEKALNDTLAFIQCESVCNGKEIMLSDYVINQISDVKYPGMGGKPIENTLTEPQRKEIIAQYYQRRDRHQFYRKEYFKKSKQK